MSDPIKLTTDQEIEVVDNGKTGNWMTLTQYFGLNASGSDGVDAYLNNQYINAGSSSVNAYKELYSPDTPNLFKNKVDFGLEFGKNITQFADPEIDTSEVNRKLFFGFSSYMLYTAVNADKNRKTGSLGAGRKEIVRFDAKRKRFLNKMMKSGEAWSDSEMNHLLNEFGWKEKFEIFKGQKEDHRKNQSTNDYSSSLSYFEHQKRDDEDATYYSKDDFKNESEWYYLGTRNQMTRREQFIQEQQLYSEFSLYVTLKRKLYERTNDDQSLKTLNENASKFIDKMYGDGLNENFWGQAKYFKLRNKYFGDYEEYLTKQRNIIKDGLLDYLKGILTKLVTLTEEMTGFLNEATSTQSNLAAFLSRVQVDKEKLNGERQQVNSVLSEYAPELKKGFLDQFDTFLLSVDRIISDVSNNIRLLTEEQEKKNKALEILKGLNSTTVAVREGLIKAQLISDVYPYLQNVAQLFLEVEQKGTEFRRNLDLNSRINTKNQSSEVELTKQRDTRNELIKQTETIKVNEISRRESEMNTLKSSLMENEVDFLEDTSGGASFDLSDKQVTKVTATSDIPLEVYSTKWICLPVGNTSNAEHNRSEDVKVIQGLLVKRGYAEVKITGAADTATKTAISAYQKDFMKSKNPDGMITPGGDTFWHLVLGRNYSKIDRKIFNVELFNDLIDSAALEFDMPSIYLKSIMAVESGGVPNASSGAAWGLMQITKGTWSGTQKNNTSLNNFNFAENWFLPEVNIRFGAAVLKSKAESLGVTSNDPNFVALAITAYNGGQEVVKNAIKYAKEDNSTDPYTDFLKPEYLKKAIGDFESVYKYYTTGRGKSSNKDPDQKKGAIDLKYKEISGYALAARGYLEYYGQGNDYDLVTVPEIKKKRINTEVVMLVTDFLSGVEEQNAFKTKFETLMTTQSPSVLAVIQSLSKTDIGEISERFLGETKHIYETETPQYYQKLIARKTFIESYEDRAKIAYSDWKVKQEAFIKEREVLRQKQLESKAIRDELNRLEEQFNCGEMNMREFTCGVIPYADTHGKEVLAISNRMNNTTRYDFYSQLTTNASPAEYTTFDSGLKSIMEETLSKPVQKNTTDKNNGVIDKPKGNSTTVVINSEFYGNLEKMLDEDCYKNGHAFISFTGLHSGTVYKKGDKISTEDAILTYRSNIVTKGMVSDLKAKGWTNATTNADYKKGDVLSNEHQIEYYRAAQEDKPLPTWCNQFIFDYSEDHLNDQVFNDVAERYNTNATGMLTHMQKNTDKFEKLTSFEQCWKLANSGSLILLAAPGHISTVYPTPEEQWTTSSKDKKNRKFGKVIQAGRSIGIVPLNHAWNASDFDEIEMFLFKPSKNGSLGNNGVNNQKTNVNDQKTNGNEQKSKGQYERPQGEADFKLGIKYKPEDFKKTFGPTMIQVTEGTALFPSVKLAQMALETGWGEHTVGEGKNLFGIKATGEPNEFWNGESVPAKTKERYDGVEGTYTLKFRKYATYKDCMMDHSRLLLTVDRYKPALEAKTPEEQTKAIHKGGYATGEDYAEKLMKIIDDYGFKDLDAGFTQSNNQAKNVSSFDWMKNAPAINNPSDWLTPERFAPFIDQSKLAEFNKGFVTPVPKNEHIKVKPSVIREFDQVPESFKKDFEINGEVGVKGSQSADIKTIQELLLLLGYSMSRTAEHSSHIDGTSGTLLKTSIYHFQSMHKIKGDMRISPGGATWKMMIRVAYTNCETLGSGTITDPKKREEIGKLFWQGRRIAKDAIPKELIPNIADDSKTSLAVDSFGYMIPAAFHTRMEKLARCLEHIDKAVKDNGGKGIKIVSGYRSPEKNSSLEDAAVNSNHTIGEAADIICIERFSKDKKTHLEKYHNIIMDLMNEGKIDVGAIAPYWGSNNAFIHYDIRGNYKNWNGANGMNLTKYKG